MKKQRLQRSSINGQEETCSALWEFARDVLDLDGHHSFQNERRGEHKPATNAQLAAIRKAMSRISEGYGYRLVEIQ